MDIDRLSGEWKQGLFHFASKWLKNDAQSQYQRIAVYYFWGCRVKALIYKRVEKDTTDGRLIGKSPLLLKLSNSVLRPNSLTY
jgi:hypothetical protein